MRNLSAIGLVAFLSVLSGFGAGYLWLLGNHAAASGLGYLVLLAIPGNLLAAMALYALIMGGVSLSRASVALFVVLGCINLSLTIGTAALLAGVMGSGTGKVGAHVFSWGMAYAYGQAFHDLRYRDRSD